MQEDTSGSQPSEEPQSERGEMGSRDTGSDGPSGGPTDRPEGAVRGDESVPSHGGSEEGQRRWRRKPHAARDRAGSAAL